MKYDGKNVLVTGGAGFIGSALVRELIAENANVIVLDNMLIGDHSNLESVKDQIDLISGDIRNPDMADFLQKKEVEYIFNLAAEPYIPHCYERPHQFFEINANGALNMMIAAKEAGVKRFLQYSTSEVYGTAKQTPMDEHHPTNPMSTYAVSKLAADRLAYTLYHEQDIPIITLRQFNCYGPRETQPYIIPELISQLAKSNELSLGNIKASRDFTYVHDAARAAMELMKHESAEGEIFNNGSGIDYTIEELAHTVASLMGHDDVEISVDPAKLRPLDVERLQCNYFKLHELTGWKPTTPLEDGLRETINDFKENDETWVWEEKTGTAVEDVWYHDTINGED